MRFKPNKRMDFIALSEAFDHVISMFPDAFDQIGCNANIKRAIAVAGQNIDAGLLHALLKIPVFLKIGLRIRIKKGPGFPPSRE